MKLDWKAGLGLGVTVLLLWWALKDVRFGELWVQVRQGDLVLLGAAVFVATFGFLIRAVRWKILLTPLRPDTTLHNRFAAVSVGFMANNVLPARVGEFARAYALSRVEPVTASGAFGTLVVERVLDGLTLLGLLLFAVSWPTFPAGDVLRDGPLGGAIQVVTGIILVLMAGMLALLVRPRPFVRGAEAVASRLPADFARPLLSAFEAFLDSLAVLRSPVLLAKAVAWSVLFWVWHGMSFWLGMLAFGIAPEDAFVAALFTEAVVGFGVALPSAPGFVGTFHASAGWALSSVYGVDPARSLAFAFGYHFGGWLPITAIGLWYAWRLGLTLGDVEESEERVEEEVEAEHPRAAELLAGRRGGDAAPGDARSAGEGSGVVPAGAVAEVEAPAKVNLLLRVLDRRPDGFHRIETLFQAVDLRDRLRVEVAPPDAAGGEGGVELTVTGADVGPVRENLVWRATRAFADAAGLDAPVRIRLEKAIPAGAGLGGGSSDAAATLRALNALAGEPLDGPALRELGGALGSDVPFFLGESPLALAHGRGEQLQPLPPLPEAWLVVATPAVHVATGEAYATLAERRAAEGAEPAGERYGPGDAWSWASVGARAENDFEDVLLPAEVEVAMVHGFLGTTGADVVLLSGSGAAVFALFTDPARARGAAAAARERFPGTPFHEVRTLGAWPGVYVDGTG